MARLRPRRLRSRELVEEAVPYVLNESTRAAIEKMAAEFAREMLADPKFREDMRAAVRELAHECSLDLRDFRENLVRARRRQ